MSNDLNDKVSNSLADYLTTNNISNVEVVIELDNAVAKPDQKITMHEAKSSFQEDVTPIASFLEKNGGNLIDSLWLNRTVKAVVPTDKINDLANLGAVSTIDLPKKIKLD